MSTRGASHLSGRSLRQITGHVSSQHHAMAGAIIAASAAQACALGEACVRISRQRLEGASDQAQAEQAAAAGAEALATIRQRLLALADEDGAAITTFAALRAAGQMLQGQDRLCEMPGEIGGLSIEAAQVLQDFRPWVRHVQDDLEMALVLLVGAARAASLLLDSNLRLWPEPPLLAKHEPILAALRSRLALLRPSDRIRL